MNKSLSPLPVISPREFIFWLIRLRKRVRVNGNSMKPSLTPGDEILYNPKAYFKKRPKVGDVVIISHPQKQQLNIIKRITDQVDSKTVIVKGDNPLESIDSRDFGPVKTKTIRGQVTCIFNAI